jgi:hypothetical protein
VPERAEIEAETRDRLLAEFGSARAGESDAAER